MLRIFPGRARDKFQVHGLASQATVVLSPLRGYWPEWICRRSLEKRSMNNKSNTSGSRPLLCASPSELVQVSRRRKCRQLESAHTNFETSKLEDTRRPLEKCQASVCDIFAAKIVSLSGPTCGSRGSQIMISSLTSSVPLRNANKCSGRLLVAAAAFR